MDVRWGSAGGGGRGMVVDESGGAKIAVSVRDWSFGFRDQGPGEWPVTMDSGDSRLEVVTSGWWSMVVAAAPGW